MEECLVKQARSTAEDRCPPGRVGEDGREWAEFSGGIRLLVQQLVDAIDRRAGAPAGEPEDKVILDVEVSGVRCVLVRRPPETGRPEGALSPREREIARMVAKGYPNKVIARVLEISSWTVSTHLRRIFAKLGVSSRAAMVAQLFEDGKLGDSPRDGARPPGH
jgi:DNA-binding CsgD family transcriptional regulator